MKEYLVKYKIGTDWHEPHNTITWNYYTEVVSANSAKEAVKKEIGIYSFSNPNKSIELISVKLIG